MPSDVQCLRPSRLAGIVRVVAPLPNEPVQRRFQRRHSLRCLASRESIGGRPQDLIAAPLGERDIDRIGVMPDNSPQPFNRHLSDVVVGVSGQCLEVGSIP